MYTSSELTLAYLLPRVRLEDVIEVKDVAEDVVGGPLRGEGLGVQRTSGFARRWRVTRRRRL